MHFKWFIIYSYIHFELDWIIKNEFKYHAQSLHFADFYLILSVWGVLSKEYSFVLLLSSFLFDYFIFVSNLVRGVNDCLFIFIYLYLFFSFSAYFSFTYLTLAENNVVSNLKYRDLAYLFSGNYWFLKVRFTAYFGVFDTLLIPLKVWFNFYNEFVIFYRL